MSIERGRERVSGAHLSEAPIADEPAARAVADRFAVADDDRYQPIAELGRGGMGTVVSAIDRRLGREVALKRIGDVGDRAAAAVRFAREAAITASLDHPAIVPIYDASVGADGEPYYTMRLVRGRTLGAALAATDGSAGRLRLVRAFLGACEAVAHAHSRGVVHRDLKPDNILVGELGDTQVVDWGVARRIDEAGADRGPEAAAHALTRAGAVVGTPAYMSPEQAAGEPTDPRADVYSLGAVLFEIAAGRPLRDGEATTVAAAVPAGPAHALPAEVPAELHAIVRRALAAAPARYPDAIALAADVASYLDGRRVAAHRYSAFDELRRWARRRRAPLTVAAIALVLLLGVGAWALIATRAERDRARAAERTAVVARDDAAASLGRALVEQALTAQLALAQPEAEVLAAHALTFGESPAARGVLAGFAFAGRPALIARVALPACDAVELGPADAVLCVRERSLSLVDADGRTRWRAAGRVLAASWLDHGRAIAIRGDDEGAILDAATGAVRTHLSPPIAAPPFQPAVGGALAVLLDNAQLTLVDAARAPITVAPCIPHGGHLAASVDASDVVVVACRHATVAIVDPDGVTRRVVPIALADGADLAAAALAPDGRRLVVASMTGELQTVDATTGARLAGRRSRLGVVRKLAFTADGALVALVGDRGGVSVWSPATWALRWRLPAVRDASVRWSADGRVLATAGRELRRWRLDRDRPAIELREPRPPGLAAADLSADGARLATAAGDGSLVVDDTRDGSHLLVDRIDDHVVKGATFLADGGVLAWTAGATTVRRYDRDLRTAETYPGVSARRAALLPSGWLLVAPYLHEIDLVDPARARTVRFGDHQLLDLDQTAGDRRRLVAVDLAGTIWTIDDGDPPATRALLARPGAVAVAVAGDGGLLAAADDRHVELIDPASGRTLRVVDGLGVRIFDVALSPDGALVAAADGDRRARIWSTADGRLLAELAGHEARVVSVRFAGPRTLVTASWDGTARVWGLAALDRSPALLDAELSTAWGITPAAAGAAPLR